MKPDKFVWFDSLDACAKSAAEVFLENRWRWGGSSGKPGRIPNEGEIQVTLLSLKTELSLHPHYGCIETGRLKVTTTQFGHHKGKDRRVEAQLMPKVDQSGHLGSQRD